MQRVELAGGRPASLRDQPRGGRARSGPRSTGTARRAGSQDAPSRATRLLRARAPSPRQAARAPARASLPRPAWACARAPPPAGSPIPRCATKASPPAQAHRRSPRSRAAHGAAGAPARGRRPSWAGAWAPGASERTAPRGPRRGSARSASARSPSCSPTAARSRQVSAPRPSTRAAPRNDAARRASAR